MRRGMSMHKWIQRRVPDAMQGLWMLNAVCSQLAAMHDAQFVHRDIKPANILWLQVRVVISLYRSVYGTNYRTTANYSNPLSF
jgi:tRNA A-37 threonylcarbamoyl transferase component Bud32